VYSLNVPLPSAVPRLATDLARRVPGGTARTRGEHTLVAKRCGDGDATAFGRYEARARERLAGTPPFECRIERVEYFESAASGPSPVVYLAVDSPGLEAVHDALCEEFPPVEDIEGEAYVPHVTIARGGALDTVRELAGPVDEPVQWTVEELAWYDAERGVTASRLSLPA
jgi:2'-5' RNA ligase